LRNSRKTDSLPEAKSAEFLFRLVPPKAAFALLRNSRKTEPGPRTRTTRLFGNTWAATEIVMKTARILAFFLVGGGLLGILNAVLTGFHLGAFIGAALFSWSIVTGVALWRRTPAGFAGAKILFALQIPVFSVARLLYEFSTFFSFRLMIGDTSHYIGGNVGSSCNIRLFPHSVGFLFGINIVAVVALFCVMRVSRAVSAEIPAAARLVNVEYR
jgi:hypothetical protein